MLSPHRSYLVLFVFAALPLVAQRSSTPAPAPGAQQSPSPAFLAQALPPDANEDTKALTALQYKFEDATIHGDVAFVDSVEDPTMTMVHGDHWTTGRLAQLADDKAAYDNRVTGQFYFVHDIDPTTLRYELHKDIAICYGRYLSVTRGRIAPPAAAGSAPRPMSSGSITTIWFMRVFKKRPDGQWIYLSHRTVHGPIPTPAAIDPTRVPWDATPAEAAKIPLTVPNDPMNRPGAPAGGVPVDKDPTISKGPEAEEVLAFERKQEAAVVSGDVTFLKDAVADDFSMVHGDAWIRGGKAMLVDDKTNFLKRAETKYYAVRDLDHQKVEMHGDVAVTYGRYLAYVPSRVSATPNQAWFSVWYERVFEKVNGKWVFVSHRTVFGPTYGASREAIADK